MDDLLESAREHGNPLVDDQAATFVWEGDEGARVVSDFNGWGRESPPLPLQQVAPRLWTLTLPLPADAYVEYDYQVGDERIHDPLNPHLKPDGMGGFHNWFAMPGFTETPLSTDPSDGSGGTVTHHDVECCGYAIGETRPVHLYQPPTDHPCPLLVVFDGQDYLHHGRLVQIVDNLIAQGRIRPINMALVDHGYGARFVEYSCNDATVRFLQRIVFPLAREHLKIVDDAALHGVLGASMGGLMALYTALRAPTHFGRVLSQSGAFSFPNDDRFGSVISTVARYADIRPIVWMDVGRYEALIETNRRMYSLLTERGYTVTYREYTAGHNHVAWRNDVWRGIEELYRV